MKRILSILAAAAVMSLMLITFSGCFGSSDPPPEVKIEDLYGIWTYTKEGSGIVTVTFHENNRYTLKDTLKGTASNSMGDYSLDGNKITLTPSEGTDKSVHEITAFDGDTMVWGSGSFSREYKKEK